MGEQTLTVAVGESAAFIAAEIERLRNEVVAQRVRVVEGSANKDWLLTLLADAARQGVRRVSPPELARKLEERFGYQPRPNTKPEPTIRKALFDITRVAREWYESHQEHVPCVLFSTSGRIDVFTSGLPKHADDREQLEALRTLLTQLPDVVRDTVGLMKRPLAHIDQTTSLRERIARIFGADTTASASAGDLSLVTDLLYASNAHGIEMAIRAFQGQIIAVERHPTHNIFAWDGSLKWLDDAYREYRLRQGEVLRLVVLEDEARQRLVENSEDWTNWVAHIRSRLVTDKVCVVLDPLPEWKDAMTRDLLILPDILVIEFEQEDFPFSCRAHRGRSVLSITAAAEAIVQSTDQQHVFPIETARSAECFDELRRRLHVSVQKSNSPSSRARH